MKTNLIRELLILLILTISFSCNSASTDSGKSNGNKQGSQTSSNDTIPEPGESHTNLSRVIGWPKNKTPQAPEGFKVEMYANDLDNPRWIYEGPNGDIFIAESATGGNILKKVAGAITGNSDLKRSSANRIILLRDTDKDGKPDLKEVFIKELNKPFGMLILGNYFYIANTDGVFRYTYTVGQTKLNSKGKKIISLPAGGYNNHWTRNLLASRDGSKIYVTVGSGSNAAEHGIENEKRRANVLEINPDGSGEKIYASGLRNPVGLDWAPGTNVLWTAVNERDGLGDDLVPDFMTGLKEGAFYGWPYSYFGNHVDPRLKGQRADLVKKAIVPDVNLGAHTASLGLAFYDQKAFPEKYRNGAFVGQHGSWNRSKLVGYRVAFVPFKNGNPIGPPEDFLTGFIANAEKSEVYGRPVCVRVLNDGSMLVSDDAGNTIWIVSVK